MAFKKLLRDSEMFDRVVGLYFEPIARKYQFSLLKVRDGIYEISSRNFILRIRLDTGHARGLNVILRRANMSNFDENEPFVQYGIGCFMKFHGENLNETFIEVQTDEDFKQRAKLLAIATERFAIPYLLNQAKDFDAITELVDKESRERAKEIGEYKFPKNVQKAW